MGNTNAQTESQFVSESRAKTDIEAAAGNNTHVTSEHGNRSFGRMLGRMVGDGLLPGGRVAQAVEQMITQRRGLGIPLQAPLRKQFSESFDDSLTDVRLHTDQTADTLARSVAAKAFTVGSDVYFARGEYQPQTRGGKSLLAHELTHVLHQRGARSGPLTVSDPNDRYEREADRVANEFTQNL